MTACGRPTSDIPATEYSEVSSCCVSVDGLAGRLEGGGRGRGVMRYVGWWIHTYLLRRHMNITIKIWVIYSNSHLDASKYKVHKLHPPSGPDSVSDCIRIVPVAPREVWMLAHYSNVAECRYLFLFFSNPLVCHLAVFWLLHLWVRFSCFTLEFLKFDIRVHVHIKSGMLFYCQMESETEIYVFFVWWNVRQNYTFSLSGGMWDT